ncbi:hypothetical protein Trydic_g4249 [Trypoxylus dichotomus]
MAPKEKNIKSILKRNKKYDTGFTSPYSINFRDVDDTIRKYDGTDDYPVRRWVEDVEDIGKLVKWCDLHMFIYAKRQLTRLAKLFVEGETRLDNWKDFKTALLEEFGARITSAQLHRMLAKRKMHKNETLLEYFLHMKELADRGSIEEAAVIQYVLDGIYDDVNSKMVLYNAKNLQYLKEKLRVYE